MGERQELRNCRRRLLRHLVRPMQGHRSNSCQVSLCCFPLPQFNADFLSIRFSEEFPDVKFLKIDVDELPDIAQANKVSAMPTFLFFKDGQPISPEDAPSAKDGRVVGADPRKLKAVIEELVGKKA